MMVVTSLTRSSLKSLFPPSHHRLPSPGEEVGGMAISPHPKGSFPPNPNQLGVGNSTKVSLLRLGMAAVGLPKWGLNAMNTFLSLLSWFL